jgi:hypothetical protein
MIKNFNDFNINEIFDSSSYILKKKKPRYDCITHTYEFTTGKGYRYIVNLIINDRILNIGFCPIDELDNPILSSFDLLNNFETNKIFSTIKIILDKHNKEFDTLRTHSEPKRIRTYKELLKKLGYDIIQLSSTDITAKNRTMIKNEDSNINEHELYGTGGVVKNS